MVLAFIGPPVRLFRFVKPAQLLLGQVWNRNQPVKVLPQAGFINGRKSGQGGGFDRLTRNARRLKGIPVIGRVLVGIDQHFPKLALLQLSELDSGFFSHFSSERIIPIWTVRIKNISGIW